MLAGTMGEKPRATSAQLLPLPVSSRKSVGAIPLAAPGYMAGVWAAASDSIAFDANPFSKALTSTYSGTLADGVGTATFKLIAASRWVDAHNRLVLDDFGTPARGGYPFHVPMSSVDLEHC